MVIRTKEKKVSEPETDHMILNDGKHLFIVYENKVGKDIVLFFSMAPSRLLFCAFISEFYYILQGRRSW